MAHIEPGNGLGAVSSAREARRGRSDAADSTATADTFVRPQPLTLNPAGRGHETVAAGPERPIGRIKTNSVAALINEPTTMLFGDPFFAPLITGIYQAVASRSLLLVLLIPRSGEEMQLARTYLTSGHVDGAILVSLHSRSPLPAQLLERGLPVVSCGRPALDTAVSYADTDNRHGGESATQHLISLGRRRIATISGDLDLPAARDRLAGHRDALAAAGITPDPTLEEIGGFVPDRALIAMERLLINHPDVDAVFIASDAMAVAALDVIRRAGRRIPEDIAVIGYDDSAAAQATQPALSSIRQSIEGLGAETVSLLIRTMADPGGEPRQTILETELVVRESTAGKTGPVALP